MGLPSKANKQNKDFPTLYNPFSLGDDRRLSGSRTDVNIIKVNAIHRQVIALHLSGWTIQNIATAIDKKHSWVSNVLASPAVREIIKGIYAEVDDQLAALFPLAVSTVKSVMEKGSDSAKMKAAELVLNSQGKLKSSAPPAETAEDVIAKIMARIEVSGKAVISIGASTSRTGGALEYPEDTKQIDVTPIPADAGEEE